MSGEAETVAAARIAPEFRVHDVDVGARMPPPRRCRSRSG